MNIGLDDLENTAITTSQPREHLIEVAQAISAELDIKYIPKNKLSIKKLQEIYKFKYLVVVREDRIQVVAESDFFFHPGMSIPRIKVLKKGAEDTMIKAMDLKPGDKVLDCTLGLANDAIVASFIVGETGLVLGIESSPLIYVITKYSLQSYNKGSKAAQQAMRNIKVIWSDYTDYLPKLNTNSFDVVYFDPMFSSPLLKSSGIKNLRNLANYQQLDVNFLREALRVAKKRVVIKNRKNGNSFTELQVDEIQGGKYSPIAFGIYHKEKHNF